MELKDLGEFGLIERIRKKTKMSNDVIVGIGDDCAAVKYKSRELILYTADSLVENVHFSRKYFKPSQIGAKSIEQNASDIAAMGGIPEYALISLMLPQNLDVKFVDSLYEGILTRTKKYNIQIIGGNISRSKEIIVSIMMTGIADKKHLILRSGARKGNLIFCTGNLGASAAGLQLLKQKKKGASIKKHLNPRCRLDISSKIAKYATSMIDISDGLVSEIRHICNESKVGAIIHAEKIPISKTAANDAKRFNKDPLDFALYGGEDFELLFTAPKNKAEQLKNLGAVMIGGIADRKNGIKILKNGKKINLKKGFEHF